jgi:CheY-like chemotaxis protein
VVANFLSNAIKFCKARGTIHVFFDVVSAGPRVSSMAGFTTANVVVHGAVKPVESEQRGTPADSADEPRGVWAQMLGAGEEDSGSSRTSTADRRSVEKPEWRRQVGEPIVVRVSVADEGPGVRAKDMKLLFRRFEQVRAGLLQDGRGSGLGLSISRALVKLHGGRVGALSAEGSGSEFFMEVPVEVMHGVDESGIDRSRRIPALPAPVYNAKTIKFPLTEADPLADAEADTPFLPAAESLGFSPPTLRRHKVETDALGTSGMLTRMTQAGAGVGTASSGTYSAAQAAASSQQQVALLQQLLAASLSQQQQQHQQIAMAAQTAAAAAGVTYAAHPVALVPDEPQTQTLVPQGALAEPVAAKPTQRKPQSRTVPPKGIRCLVVEDDPGNRKLLCRLLQSKGYVTDSADCGEAAVEHLEGVIDDRNPPPDIILLDRRMPGMDGEDVARWVRKQESDHVRSLPIIMVSADATAQKDSMHLAGVSEVASKPVDTEKLMAAIDRLVSKA